MDYVTTQTKAPKVSHFAAIIFSTIHIPGDERSRTNPGHGYPERDEPVVKYIAFDSREKMEKWAAKQEATQYGRRGYQLVEATPLSVVVTTSVSVGK